MRQSAPRLLPSAITRAMPSRALPIVLAGLVFLVAPVIVIPSAVAQTQHTLSVDVTGEGSGEVTSDPEGISCPGIEGPCSANFDEGTEVTLTATPDESNIFTGWGGDCAFALVNPTCTLTMDADKSVTANFEPEPVTVADLSIDKSDTPDPESGDTSFGPDPVGSGDIVVYKITVSNAGPDPATGVTVTDTPTPGTVLANSGGSGWTCSIDSETNTATCTRSASLASGTSDGNLRIWVRAPSTSTGATITDTASVDSNESDPNETNDTDVETTTVIGSGSAQARDQDATFFDGVHTATVSTKRDTIGGFYSMMTVRGNSGIQPGVISINERPAAEFPTLCGGHRCDAQVQITGIPAGRTGQGNAIRVTWFYVQGGDDDDDDGKIWVQGDNEVVASVLRRCVKAGIANPPKCVSSKTTLANGDTRYLLLWRDGGDPKGGKG